MMRDLKTKTNQTAILKTVLKMPWRASLLASTMLFAISAQAAEPIARIDPVSGQVISTRQGENILFVDETTKRTVIAGQDLKAGDILNTNSNGALAIVFADQTQIRLARNTTLEIKEMKQGKLTRLQILRGRLWARAPRGKSRLNVETPSATAAIRGTEWSLEVADTRTQLVVASGEVSFFNDFGTIAVAGGEAASARPDSAPVKEIIVNRPGREQMLYFLPEEAFAPSGPDNDTLKMARQAASLGEFERAIEILEDAEKSGNKSADLYALKARIGLLIGDSALIERAVDKGLSQNPENPTLLALKADYQANYLGRPDLALVNAQKAAEIAPQNAEILLTLGKILLERRADKEAMSVIEKAIAANPNHAELYVQQADIYLAQNRPNKARKALNRAFEISPNLSLARLGYGQIYALQGKHDLALQEFLATSADNPGYSAALLRLAEAYGRKRERSLAEQQLDTADRLDPNSPYPPLYRTALGIDLYESGDAVEGAREALRRFRARGGIYETLSENRETGSNLSRSFRFLELNALGRYYGDRVFDSFESTSYFDEVLNESAGLFYQSQDTTGFNPKNGDEIQQISSFMQGVSLDPLSVANSERRLQISKEAFLEATLNGTSITSSDADLRRDKASLQGRFYPAIGNGGLPLAFSLKGQRTSYHDDLQETVRDSSAIESYVGMELTPYDNIAFYGTYRDESYNITADRTDFLQRFGGEHDFTEHQYFGALVWNRKLANRRHFTLAGGWQQKDDLDIFYTPQTNFVERLTEDGVKTTSFLMASYAKGYDRQDVKFGIELFRKDIDVNYTTDALFTDGTVSTIGVRNPGYYIDEQVVYFDTRYTLSDKIVLQGQISYFNESSNDPQITADLKGGTANYRLGIAYEPNEKHWLRAASSREKIAVLPFTLAPLYTVGLKESLLPLTERSEIDNQLVRWDAHWSDKFFTAVEMEHQTFNTLSYLTPDQDAAIDIFDGYINHITVSANYLPGGNWAVNARYTLTNAEADDAITNGTPQTLPYLPSSEGGVGIVWTHPNRLKVNLRGIYIGKQVDTQQIPIGDHFTVDLITSWEPYDKRYVFELGALNLLDESYEVQPDVPAPGFTLFVSGGVRF